MFKANTDNTQASFSLNQVGVRKKPKATDEGWNPWAPTSRRGALLRSMRDWEEIFGPSIARVVPEDREEMKIIGDRMIALEGVNAKQRGNRRGFPFNTVHLKKRG